MRRIFSDWEKEAECQTNNNQRSYRMLQLET